MKRFTSKLSAMQASVPVFACTSCREKHDAPKHARCTGCNHTTKATVRIPGQKTNKNCPNCARPLLKNEHIKPFACRRCGGNEFDYFHSTGEYNLFAQLAMLNDNGKITNLRRQVPFPIKIKGDPKPITTYMADFVFDEQQQGGEVKRRVIDYKGNEVGVDSLFKLKKKLVERFYPGVTIEVLTK